MSNVDPKLATDTAENKLSMAEQIILKNLDAEKQKKASEAARNELRKAIGNNKKGDSSFTGATIEAGFSGLFEKIEGKWEKEREKASGQDILNLAQKTDTFAKELEELVEILKGYTTTMYKGTPVEEGLAKMTGSKMNADVLTAALMQGNKNLNTAFKWVLNVKNVDKDENEKATNSEESKTITFKYLTSEFEDENGKKGYEKNIAPIFWMVVTLMNPQDRAEFTQMFIEKSLGKDFEKTMDFLEKGNLMGSYSPQEMEELIEKSFGKTGFKFDAEKRKEYEFAYKLQHDFVEAGRLIMSRSHGSKNRAGEMFTFGNILMFAGQVAATTTIGANSILGFFHAGGFRNPKEGIKNAIMNHNNHVAGGLLIAINQLQNGEPIKNLVKGREQIEREKTMTAHENFKICMHNYGWNELFATAEGLNAFTEFTESTIMKETKLDKGKLKMEEFVRWMKIKSNLNPELKAKYEPVLAKITFEEGGYKVNGYEVKDHQVERLATSFFTLGILGAESRLNYEKERKITKGETPIIDIKPQITGQGKPEVTPMAKTEPTPEITPEVNTEKTA